MMLRRRRSEMLSISCFTRPNGSMAASTSTAGVCRQAAGCQLAAGNLALPHSARLQMASLKQTASGMQQCRPQAGSRVAGMRAIVQ